MTTDASTPHFFLRATYKYDNRHVVSVNVHNFTLYRDSKFPGMYNASCVFYRDHSYIAENELRRVLSDFAAGRIGVLLEFIPYGDKDETNSYYRALTAPDIDITPTEITLTCTFLEI